MSDFAIRRLAIIGVGLIGGSLARALRRAGVCRDVVGAGRHAGNLDRAVEIGVLDRGYTDPARAVEGADMVVVAVPLGSMEAVFRAIAPCLSSDAVLTDVGSAKASVVEAARAAFGEAPPWFVPGHPIAGTEKSGVEASFATLFEDRRVILTPDDRTDPVALGRVRAMWEATGAHIGIMDVAHHDAVLAVTSHLPHLLAYALVDHLASRADHADAFDCAAGGFRDFTRIAGSDPVMWRDICLANRAAILAALDGYAGQLARLRDALDRSDGDRLIEVFRNARDAREHFVAGIKNR